MKDLVLPILTGCALGGILGVLIWHISFWEMVHAATIAFLFMILLALAVTKNPR